MIRSLPTLSLIVFVLIGCHTDVIKEPRPIDYALSKIAGTWQATNVSLDNVRKEGFDTYKITFSEGSNDRIEYKMSIWPSAAELPNEGTLNVGADVTSELITDKGLLIQYAVEDSKLYLTYQSKVPKTGSPTVEIISMWRIEYEKVN